MVVATVESLTQTGFSSNYVSGYISFFAQSGYACDPIRFIHLYQYSFSLADHKFFFQISVIGTDVIFQITSIVTVVQIRVVQYFAYYTAYKVLRVGDFSLKTTTWQNSHNCQRDREFDSHSVCYPMFMFCFSTLELISFSNSKQRTVIFTVTYFSITRLLSAFVL